MSETGRGATSVGSCPDCGAPVADREACRVAFERLLERDYSGFAPHPIHRLAVDAYCLQHPDEYMKSAKSAAAHLTGVVHAFEYDASPRIGRALEIWLDGGVEVTRPEPPPPGDRGRMTIADVLGAEDPEEHGDRVRRWAVAAWDAWSPHHATARRWVEEALAGHRGG